MTEPTTIDPAVEIAAIRERGAEHLERLRREHAERRAELDRIDTEERARLAAAEREFAANLAAKQRELALQEAHEAYATASGGYTELVTAAEERIAKVETLTAELADAYRDALDAEYSRVTAGEQLRALVRDRLEPLNAQVGEPSIGPKRLLGRELNPVRELAAARHNDTDAAVARLTRHHTKTRHIANIQGVPTEIWS